MRARMVKTASVLMAGILMVSTVYIQSGIKAEADEAVKESYSLTAGISAELAEQIGMAEPVDVSLSSGVTETVGIYLAETAEIVPDAKVSETDAVTTAVGQAETFGYTNLGVAQVDGNLNVRKEPSIEAEIVGKMPNNAGCEILGVEGEWTKIQSGKVEGYVKSEYLLTGEAALAKAAEVKQTIATVNTTTLRVRQEPNTESKIMTTVPKGEELEVIEIADDWITINMDNDKAYVSSGYVDISVELAKAQTMTEVRYGQGVSDVRVSLVQYATQFVGNPYVWGGTSLTRGADCSGFVMSIFANYGIYLPRTSGAQAGSGTKISASEAQPGDLFFYGNGSRINHVAIYIGNGQVVHASSPKSGIKISGAYYRTPVKVVRVIHQS